MAIIWNIKSIKERCLDLGIQCLSEEYNYKNKQLFKCSCGNEFERKFSNVNSGQIYCLECRTKIDENLKREELSNNFNKFKKIVEDSDSGCTLLSKEDEYKGNKTKMKMMCECGNIFNPTANNFMRGIAQKCTDCGNKDSGIKKRKSKEEIFSFIEDKGYIPISYSFRDKKHWITVKCEKENHEQYDVDFGNFYMGNRCPKCNLSKGETRIGKYLSDNSYDFEPQFTFDDLRGKNNRMFRFDFGIKLNKNLILVEFDGEQHFKPKFGNVEFERTKINDKIKNEYCKNNNIKLLRITYKEIDEIESILEKYLNHANTEITNSK